MTSVVQILMSFAMTLSLLLSSGISIFASESVPAASDTNAAEVSHADGLNSSGMEEIILINSYDEDTVSAVSLCEEETVPDVLIGEGVSSEAAVSENRPAPAAEHVSVDSAVPQYDVESISAAVIGEGVSSEAAVSENRPAPAVEMDSAPVYVEESRVSVVVGGGVYNGEPVAIDVPAPPVDW